MKTIVLTFFVFLTTIVVFAQQSNIDVVYLKNGTVFRGEIIEQVPDLSLKIKTSEGNILVIPMDNVKKITKEQEEMAVPVQSRPIAPLPNETQSTTPKPEQKATNWRRMYIVLGFNNITIFDYSTYGGGKFEFGYYINPKNLLSIEIGGGSDEFEDNCNMYLASWSYMVNLSEKFQWRIGPSLGILDIEDDAAFTFGGNTGILWNFSKNKRWFLDLGGRLYRTPYDTGSQMNLSVGWRF